MPHRILVHDVPARRTRASDHDGTVSATTGTPPTTPGRRSTSDSIRLWPRTPGGPRLNVGTTYEGRTIQGVRIGTSDEGIKPAVLFNGCQHAGVGRHHGADLHRG